LPPTAALGLLALGVDASDSGVDLGSLVFVDPPGWCPFRQIVGIDAAGPTFLQKMRVVISTQQRQIASIALRVP
jgi:hypothetical protein